MLSGSISTYVFSVRDGKPVFLLLFRSPHLLHANEWQAVHGMIEPGESAAEAARREMIEETALEPQRFFVTDFVETFYSEHTDAVHLVPAFAAFVTGAPAATVSEEHTAYAWCDLEEAVTRFAFPSQRQAIRLIAAAAATWPEVSDGMRELV